MRSAIYYVQLTNDCSDPLIPEIAAMTALECLGYDAPLKGIVSIFRDINVRYPSPKGTGLREASLKPVQTQS